MKMETVTSNGRAKRDGKIPINKAGLFSFLFMSWMSPLVWRMFRRRKQYLSESDIWECSELETCQPNTQRLIGIWEEELESHGPDKASFFNVWLKFSKTRVLVTLLVVAINAMSTFLESLHETRYLGAVSICDLANCKCHFNASNTARLSYFHWYKPLLLGIGVMMFTYLVQSVSAFDPEPESNAYTRRTSHEYRYGFSSGVFANVDPANERRGIEL